jgi:curved DNA-binding protein CbpA
MRIQRTYYEVLGLTRTASPEDIKSKYYELARQFHPDRAKDKVLAERLFVQINLAYRTLMDKDKRAVYDASLFQSDGIPAPADASRAVQQRTQPSGAPAQPAPQVDVIEAMSRANTAYMSGDRISAHKICMVVLKVDPINVDAHSLVGDIYADQGRRQEALDEYKQAASVGVPSFTLQQKISRTETLLKQALGSPPRPATPSPDRGAGSSTPPKKSGLFDRLIGRGGH